MNAERRTNPKPAGCPALDRCDLADDAAEKAVRKVFAILGVDVDQPESVESFRKDLRAAQSIRKASDHAYLAGLAVIIGAALTALWHGIKALLTAKGGG